MPTIFSRVISGELPGRFVWRDEHAVAFLTINPIKPGHTLVVPRAEIDRWTELDSALAAHLMTVAQAVGAAVHVAFAPARIGLVIAGFEVPHTHLHVLPVDSMADFNFAAAEGTPDPNVLDDAAERIRVALREAGHDASVDA